jgi:hypothetical protein
MNCPAEIGIAKADLPETTEETFPIQSLRESRAFAKN